MAPAVSRSIARRSIRSRLRGTNRDHGEGFPPMAPRIPAMQRAENDDGNEVEMLRPKISRKTLGILDRDPCRCDD